MMKKREHPTFNVPNFGAKHRKKVKARWRKQRGIDSKKRVKRSGYGAEPNIGYKNNDEVRYRRPDGRISILVHGRKELEKAIEVKDAAIVFASSISKRKKMELEKIAEEKGAKVANRMRK
jgi:large subunit ribosomal protein L32e